MTDMGKYIKNDRMVGRLVRKVNLFADSNSVHEILTRKLFIVLT